jgi:hypothetical protein
MYPSFFLILHKGLCVFGPHQGARSSKPAWIVCTHFDGIEKINARSKGRASPAYAASSEFSCGTQMINLLEVQMSPPEVLWRENDSPFSLTIPQGGEGARHDSLPGGSTGHRPETHEYLPWDQLAAKLHSYHFCDF